MKATEKSTKSAFRPNRPEPFFQMKEERNAFGGGEKNNAFLFGGTSDPPPFFAKAGIQAKLAIGQPNDRYEQEADAMADRIVQKRAAGANHPVQRMCADCAKEKEQGIAPKLQTKSIFESNEEPVQRKCTKCEAEAAREEQPAIQTRTSTVLQTSRSEEGAASSDLESRLSSTKGGGSPLPEETRSSMESSFGADFSGVKVHTDSGSVQMNQELGAQAFTHGSDIYFNSGKYSPGSTEGQRLLGHELTHVVQQGGSLINRSPSGPKNDPGPEDENIEMKAAENSVQKKGHEKGCCCPECSIEKGPEKISRDTQNQPVQKKQVNGSLIQLKPGSVVSHTFLGVGVSGGVDRKLRDRLNLVQSELQRQYDALPAAGKPATLKDYAGLDTIKGYQNRKGNHGTGKAVDVNYRNQPYIATRTTEGGTTTFGGEEGKASRGTRALRQPAVEVYDRAVSFTRTNSLTTDTADIGNRREGESATNVYRRFKRTSDALAQYFSLAFHNNYDEVKRRPVKNPETAAESDLLAIPTTERIDETIAIPSITAFMNNRDWQAVHPNYPLTPREQYFRILRDYEIVRKPMQRGNPAERPKDTRNPAKGFLHLPEHFVVAMMDVGKLRWGACEFSAKSNGDIHHFDLSTPHHSPALTSGLGAGPAQVLWKVDRSSSPPAVKKLGFWEYFQAHFSEVLPTGIYEMYAHPVVMAGDTYLKIYKKDGTLQFWPTNEYNLVEMPNDFGQRGGKDVLGGRIVNYSADDVETTEGDRYMSPEAAAALINTMGRFQLSSRNAQLAMGDASTSKGGSPRIEAGKSKRHQTHYKGNAFDARYLNAQGQSKVIGDGAFDTNANYDFIKTAVDEGYRYVIIGTDKVFKDLYNKLKSLRSIYKGLKVAREKHHNDHMHLAFNKKTPKGKIKPVKKSRAMETFWSPVIRYFGGDPDDVFVPMQRKLENPSGQDPLKKRPGTLTTPGIQKSVDESVTERQKPNAQVCLVHLHGNEENALQVALDAQNQYCANLVHLTNVQLPANVSFTNHRHITVRVTQGGTQQTWTVDPNRIFTERGIRQQLRGCPAGIKPAVERDLRTFRDGQLLPAIRRCRAGQTAGEGLAGQLPVVALHNNTPDELTIQNAVPRRARVRRGTATGGHRNPSVVPGEDHDDFLLVTTPADFQALRAHRNIVLQKTNLVGTRSDDGSLSVALSNDRYINIEAEGKTFTGRTSSEFQTNWDMATEVLQHLGVNQCDSSGNTIPATGQTGGREETAAQNATFNLWETLRQFRDVFSEEGENPSPAPAVQTSPEVKEPETGQSKKTTLQPENPLTLAPEKIQKQANNPLTSADLPAISSGTRATRVQRTAFMRDVYDRQVRLWTSQGAPYIHSVPPADLQTLSSRDSMPSRTIQLHRNIIGNVQSLLAQARTDLATARSASDPRVARVTDVRVRSGYRSATEQFGIWNQWYPQYYTDTQAHRRTLPGGEFGPDAAQYLAEYINVRVFSPGYSPHQQGQTIDITYRENGRWAKAETDPTTLAQWNASWLFDWMQQHAPAYGLAQNPNLNEPWHWETRPFDAAMIIMGRLIRRLVEEAIRLLNTVLGPEEDEGDSRAPNPE